jgi:large subunit ribosomal protein L24
MAGMRLRKGDEVMVIAGKDRGKRGRVQEVRPRDLTVIVAGVNIAKHHSKAIPAKNQ